MPEARKDDRGGKSRKSVGTREPKRDAEGLTCSEGQIEDLLSEGESVERESGENDRAEKPAQPKSLPR